MKQNYSNLLSKFKSSKAFTLIELLVVIAVLGVLAAAVVAAINPLSKINNAKDSTLKSDLGQIVGALQAYATANSGVYPANLAALVPGELKTLPSQPNATAYEYQLGTATTNAAAWGSYSNTATGVFYCWDSTNNAYKTSATAPGAIAAPVCP